MDILTFDQLPQGGFAGLRERQFVTDSKVFGQCKSPSAYNGIGNLVYLADTNFLPKGDTRMHDHKEIDVISVVVDGRIDDGRIDHAGSLQHRQSLGSGFVQVQRAGAEGFSHNEINPDNSENHMIQLWMLPDKVGEAAGYKVYDLKPGELTVVYGGPDTQTNTFYNSTYMAVVNAVAGQTFFREGYVMAYLTKGHGSINGEEIKARTLIRSESGLQFTTDNNAQLILIYTDA